MAARKPGSEAAAARERSSTVSARPGAAKPSKRSGAPEPRAAVETSETRRRSTPTTPRHVMRRDAETDGAEPNPLRVGTRLERVPDPAIVVIFGATGDLSHRKILPAFYNLRRAGLLPTETNIVGFARRPFSDSEYASEMRAAV